MALKNRTKLLAAAAIACGLSVPSNAAVVELGFDAFTPDVGFTTGQEDGFTIDGTNTNLTSLAFLVSGFSNNNYVDAVSGSSWTLDIVETDGSAFEFVSLASVGGAGDGTPELTVSGFVGSDLVGTDTFFPTPGSSDATVPFTAGNLAGLGLTRLQITGQFTAITGSVPFVDNIALQNDATAVPLPAAAWLLFGGLGVLGAVSRSRKS
ncbi:MAG: VPLPA-CTERM sorting domain-containing protein [Pseudomonadota bacterium]